MLIDLFFSFWRLKTFEFGIPVVLSQCLWNQNQPKQKCPGRLCRPQNWCQTPRQAAASRGMSSFQRGTRNKALMGPGCQNPAFPPPQTMRALCGGDARRPSFPFLDIFQGWVLGCREQTSPHPGRAEPLDTASHLSEVEKYWTKNKRKKEKKKIQLIKGTGEMPIPRRLLSRKKLRDKEISRKMCDFQDMSVVLHLYNSCA